MCVCVPCLDCCEDQKLEHYYACGDQEALWGQSARPHKFEDIVETQKVVLASQLDYG